MRIILALLMCLTSMAIADVTSEYRSDILKITVKFKIAKMKITNDYVDKLKVELKVAMKDGDLKRVLLLDSQIKEIRNEFKVTINPSKRTKAANNLSDYLMMTDWKDVKGSRVKFIENGTIDGGGERWLGWTWRVSKGQIFILNRSKIARKYNLKGATMIDVFSNKTILTIRR